MHVSLPRSWYAGCLSTRLVPKGRANVRGPAPPVGADRRLVRKRLRAGRHLGERTYCEGVRDMRRLIVCVVVTCAAVVPAAGTAKGPSGNGTMCVLHARLTAKSETTGSTSTAKGHTQIKVRRNGTI